MRVLQLLSLLLCGTIVGAQNGWRQHGDADWAPRRNHSVIVFDGPLWVIEGSIGTATISAGAWSTVDGESWVEELAVLPWYHRGGMPIVLFGGRLFALGGGGIPYWNDVFSSADGINWTQETPSAPWSPRSGHGAIAFNGRLWIFGGMTVQSSTVLAANDVWSSADGINWSLEIAAAAWQPRVFPTVVEFQGRLWLLGGGAGGFSDIVYSDIWSSSDGVQWTLETADPAWAAHPMCFGAAVYRDRLWMLETRGLEFGATVPAESFVWSTTDGFEWVVDKEAAPWPARGNYACTFKGRLWIVGGGGEGVLLNDVWSYGLHLAAGGSVGLTLPSGILNVPYSTAIAGKEGVAPFTWTHVAGSLPQGLALGTSTSDSLPVAGTPTALGTYTFTIRVEDSTGNYDEQVISLTINKQNRLIADSGTSCISQGNGLAATQVLMGCGAALAVWRRRRLRYQTGSGL